MRSAVSPRWPGSGCSCCDVALLASQSGRYGGAGGAFFISRSVDARSQPWRAWAPQHKNKNRAPKARFCGQNSPKRAGFHAFWSPKQQCNHPITPSTDPTDPARRPPDHARPADRSTTSPPLGPTLGTRPDGPLSPGPPPGAPFFVFCFLRSLAGSNYPGRPLTEKSKTLRLDEGTSV